MNTKSGLMTKYYFTNFSTEFSKCFNRDTTVDISQAIPLSQDIIDINNKKLICNTIDDEISQLLHQISLLKARGLDGMHVNFLPKMLEYS